MIGHLTNDNFSCMNVTKITDRLSKRLGSPSNRTSAGDRCYLFENNRQRAMPCTDMP